MAMALTTWSVEVPLAMWHSSSFSNRMARFSVENLFGNTDSLPSKTSEDQGLLLFDADGDKDLDLYIASGGYESKPGSSDYQDRLYINQGDGKFVPDTQALPQIFVSKSCVKAADIDRDGDLDLFVGGRVEPGKYPSSVQSFLFRNDSKNGLIRFTDVTAQIAPELMKAGMICDAIFTDINNDDWQDLVLAGEWMPIIILQNEKGKFRSNAGSEALKHASGWWNSLASGDVDNDGDIDYIAGNLGLNSFYRATPEHPVFITAGDFDGNGRFDAIPSLFLPVSAKEKMKKEFPAQLRDDMIEGIPVMRKRFPDYSYICQVYDGRVIYNPAKKRIIPVTGKPHEFITDQKRWPGKIFHTCIATWKRSFRC